MYMLLKIYDYPIFLYFFGNTISVLQYNHAFIMCTFQIIQIMMWIAPIYTIIFFANEK